MKTIISKIKSIKHLKSFKPGDKVQIDNCVSENNLYTGFHGTIKSINLIKKSENGRGILKLETKSGGELQIDGILGKLQLKKK